MPEFRLVSAMSTHVLIATCCTRLEQFLDGDGKEPIPSKQKSPHLSTTAQPNDGTCMLVSPVWVPYATYPK